MNRCSLAPETPQWGLVDPQLWAEEPSGHVNSYFPKAAFSFNIGRNISPTEASSRELNCPCRDGWSRSQGWLNENQWLLDLGSMSPGSCPASVQIPALPFPSCMNLE